jgi:hypothetical protein
MAAHERFDDPTRCTDPSSRRGDAGDSRAGLRGNRGGRHRRTAELSKGGFFHYFSGKENLALAAAAHFSQMAERLLGAAPYRRHADPLDRLLGYVDFRRARALHMQAVLQGAFVRAKAKGDGDVARDCLAHLRG